MKIDRLDVRLLKLPLAHFFETSFGRVYDRTFLSDKVGVGWKYRVRFDKSVMQGSNGGMTALYEWELLPA